MTDDLGGNILLLSGHPGSGKSTIAEALANLPGVPKVHFHSDDLWGYIKHGRIDPWLPQSHQQNRMIMQIAADVAGRYAKEGYFVILDGVVRPDWLPAFTALARPLHYIVLRTTAAEAIERCLARGGDSLRIHWWSPIFTPSSPISAPLSAMSCQCQARTRIRPCSRPSMRCNRDVSVLMLPGDSNR